MTVQPPTSAEYDYVVVGGGTAGLVVASRLSEDPNVSVLVVEAGGDKSNDPLVSTPGLLTGMFGKDEYDWNFQSVPQTSLNNRIIPQPRGRMLGGSSAINFQMWLYPSKANLDAWGALGNEGWDFDTLSPYFRKTVKTHAPSQNARDMCRMDGFHDSAVSESECGPLAITFGGGFGPNNAAWMDTFERLGLKMTADPRHGAAIGAFQQGVAIDPITKTRAYAVSAYLNGEVRRRSNLSVLTNTLVKKVILGESDDGSGDVVAKGVEIRSSDGNERTVSARMEVILAAGALQTPQILELSGVGDRTLLEKHGVPIVIENPNVGEHMQDHPNVCEGFEVADGVISGDVFRDPQVLQAVMEQYQASQDGPLSQNTTSVAYLPMADDSGVLTTEARRELFDKHLGPRRKSLSRYGPRVEQELIRTLLETPEEPSLQLILLPAQTTIPQNPQSLKDVATPLLPENYLTVMTMLNHPFSRGSCHITSPHVEEKPAWNPRYNAEDIDMEILARGVQFVEKLVGTEPLSSLFKPDGKRMQVKADSLETAKEVVRKRQISVFHVSGSAAMLPKEAGGVVDSRLKVYGTKNLRVVDASIFPLEPLGNIQSTVYAVAERAADILKEDRLKANQTGGMRTE